MLSLSLPSLSIFQILKEIIILNSLLGWIQKQKLSTIQGNYENWEPPNHYRDSPSNCEILFSLQTTVTKSKRVEACECEPANYSLSYKEYGMWKSNFKSRIWSPIFYQQSAKLTLVLDHLLGHASSIFFLPLVFNDLSDFIFLSTLTIIYEHTWFVQWQHFSSISG